MKCGGRLFLENGRTPVYLCDVCFFFFFAEIEAAVKINTTKKPQNIKANTAKQSWYKIKQLRSYMFCFSSVALWLLHVSFLVFELCSGVLVNRTKSGALNLSGRPQK